MNSDKLTRSQHFFGFEREEGEQFPESSFQRRYSVEPEWNPHWIRVAEEDEGMKIGPWVAR